MERAIDSFIESGPLGAMMIICILAIGRLYQQNQTLHAQSREDRAEVVKALLESAHAITQMASTVDKSNEFLRSILARQGG